MKLCSGLAVVGLILLGSLAACSADPGETEVKIIWDSAKPQAQNTSALMFEGKTLSGLVNKGFCYGVHITAPDLIEAGTANNDKCEVAPPGLGAMHGPYPYGATSRILIRSGQDRRIDLVGFRNPFGEADPSCSKKLEFRTIEKSDEGRGVYKEVKIYYGGQEIDPDDAEPQDRMFLFAKSDKLELLPGKQEVLLKRQEWVQHLDPQLGVSLMMPQIYDCPEIDLPRSLVEWPASVNIGGSSFVEMELMDELGRLIDPEEKFTLRLNGNSHPATFETDGEGQARLRFTPTLNWGRYEIFLGDKLFRSRLLADLSNPVLVSSMDSTRGSQASYKGNWYSYNPHLSADGRYVVFESKATNFGATVNDFQIFRKDLQQPHFPPQIVSSVDGTPMTKGNLSSGSPRISADGRYVVFVSNSSNFGNIGGVPQVFLKDMLDPSRPPVIVSSLDSTQSDQNMLRGNSSSNFPDISADGRFVVFESSSNNFEFGSTQNQIYMKDMMSPASPPKLVSRSSAAAGNDPSYYPSISADGRFIVFSSYATNLLVGSGGQQVYLKETDSLEGEPKLVSSLDGSAATKGSNPSFHPRISADGNFVVFSSKSPNFGADGMRSQVFLKNLKLPLEPPVLVSSVDGSSGSKGDDKSEYPSISADGRFVSFYSEAGNFGEGCEHQIYIKDMNDPASVPRLISQKFPMANCSPGSSSSGSLSADGKYIGFQSTILDFVDGIISGEHHIYLKAVPEDR